jgi:uncharacterized protein YjbI with pentapeptide repeats
MLRPVRAPVRPRFVSPATGASLPLEDEVEVLLKEGAPRCLRILGGPGSGKTTALAHLADEYHELARITFLDAGERLPPPASPKASALIIFVGDEIVPDAPVQTVKLAPWSRDELIEYLLATHPKECASVLSRLTRSDERQFGGVPELWRVALDELAGNPSLAGPVDAVVGYIQRSVTSPEAYEQLESSCLEGELRRCVPAQKDARPVGTLFAFASHTEGLPRDVLRLLRHTAVRHNLAALALVAQLKTSDWICNFWTLTARLPRDLVVAAGARLKNSSEAIAKLRSAALSDETEAMASSLLHAVGPGWVPPARKRPHFLEGAYLDGVHWPGIRLPKARLNHADLTRADLREANLDGADASGAMLTLARLSGASLNGFQASGTDLNGADLSAVRGSRAFFFGADLGQAKLDNATLFDASFWEADLRHTSLRGAVLRRAGFQRALLEETDFSGASLDEADLSDCVLRTCCLTGASLQGTRLMKGDLEGMCLDGLNFDHARLEGALLTGSSMAGGNLAGACLRGAGLGDIDWPGVCLRGADLRQATFHMGSSRSGLVDSTIASEGSRTGFYTDEYNEQDFKSPEEIRKANLCRADLRGASIDGVDFYLVDLRGARYDARQEAQFRQCGAILENRCSS